MMRWLVELAVGALALTGLWVTLAKAAAGILRAWEWARRDRVAPLLEDEFGCQCCEVGCCYGVDPEECGQCRHPETWHASDPLEELPPEQSAEDLGFTGLRSTGLGVTGFLSERGERRAPWWEAEHRAAYDALGFDYPSGMMARVRETAL